MRQIGHLFEGPRVAVRYRAGLRDTAGNPAHAATSILHRVIVLDPELKREPREHERILLHEYFHFTWVRTGNPKRRAWEQWLAREWKARVKGEAGWSAEWRKSELTSTDISRRTRLWREYCCESFCDTAAWLESGVTGENTLGKTRQRDRAAVFRKVFGRAPWRV